MVAEIKENLLPKVEYKGILDCLMHDSFPWNFMKGQEAKSDDIYDSHFTHMAFVENEYASTFKHIFNPLVGKLESNNIKWVKVNLMIPSGGHYKSNFHVDYEDCENGYKTSVFYLTIFKTTITIINYFFSCFT